MSTATAVRARLDRETLVYAAVLLNTELLLVLLYVLFVGPRITHPLFYVYPFVWINAAVAGVWWVGRPTAPRREKLVAGAIAVGYFLLVGYAGGLYGPSAQPTGLRVALTSLPPGWSPALLYGGEAVQLALLSFKLVGYAGLAYLVYVTVIDAAGGLVGGVLGLLSCVSCTLPVIAGVLSGVIGGGGALVAAATAQSYALSTVVFVVTVALLSWRPTMADLARLRARLS
jgi:hypothetical protein